MTPSRAELHSLDSRESAAEVSRRLRGLLRVAQDVNSSLDLPVVLDRILERAGEILGAECGSIMLLEPDRQSLRVMAASGPRRSEVCGRSQPIEEGVAGWVFREGEPLLLRGRLEDPAFVRTCDRSDVRDAICAPLCIDGRVLGVISLNNRIDAEAFRQEDLDLLVALANQAAVAIRNADSYQTMRRQRETVERLLSEITDAQLAERKRIALQLHDGPAQTMYAALRNLEIARVLTNPEAGPAKPAFDELEVTIRRSIDETRSVMLDLRPPVLDEWGLDAALRQYAQSFEKRTGIRTTAARRGRPGRLGRALESSLYRVAQEALTNVWKHSGARSARVTLEVREGDCSLEVADDGRGFEPAEAGARERDHLGMMSLRDRAQLIGGRLEIRAELGEGTTVTVIAPLGSDGAGEGETRGPIPRSRPHERTV